MKRVATLVMMAALTAMAGNALAQHNRHGGGGGGGRDERAERRQPQPPPPPPPPQQQNSGQRDHGNQRMSPQEREQLRQDIRQYRERGRN